VRLSASDVQPGWRASSVRMPCIRISLTRLNEKGRLSGQSNIRIKEIKTNNGQDDRGSRAFPNAQRVTPFHDLGQHLAILSSAEGREKKRLQQLLHSHVGSVENLSEKQRAHESFRLSGCFGGVNCDSIK
jgi:hypothetical protein